MSKLTGGGLMGVGAALVVGALALMFIIVPSMKVFPDDVDEERWFNLDYLILLQVDDMTFYRSEPGENAGLRIYRHITVEAVDGSSTLVREDQIVVEDDNNPFTLTDDDTQLIEVIYNYPLDRKSLAAVDDYPAAWDENSGIWPRTGLAIGWGIGVEQEDYLGWNEDTRDTEDLIFQREEEHAGITTYYFAAESQPARITDDQVAFLDLPITLSIPQLEELAADLDIEDPELAQTVENFLPVLVTRAVREARGLEAGEEVAVPLEYYYNFTGEYWVEPITGVLIDTVKTEHRAVTFPDDIMEALSAALVSLNLDPERLTDLLPLTVNEFTYSMAEVSTEDAKADAQDAIDQINLFGTTVPIVLIVLGIALAGAGAYVWTRASKSTP
jgi:hypothetical protein